MSISRKRKFYSHTKGSSLAAKTANLKKRWERKFVKVLEEARTKMKK